MLYIMIYLPINPGGPELRRGILALQQVLGLPKPEKPAKGGDQEAS